jgi:hypothetical protein
MRRELDLLRVLVLSNTPFWPLSRWPMVVGAGLRSRAALACDATS